MAAVAAPADRRFRRAHVKPGSKRRAAARRGWLVFRVIAVLALAGYGGWRGTVLIVGAPALRVSHISLRGNQRLSNGELLGLVDALRGRNILQVDLSEWRSRLLASPWVEDAHVRRVLPSRVEIEIRERQPIGIARLSGGLYLVDAHGVVIDEYGPNYADLDLPLIDGLATTAGRPRAGKGRSAAEKVAVSRTASGDATIDAARAALAARLIAALATRPDLAERISHIDVSDPHDALVLLDNDTAMLRLGEGQFVDRIQEYLNVAPALRERVTTIDYVDMRFGERVYVKTGK
jgi:cell division septal protein FtsQ